MPKLKKHRMRRPQLNAKPRSVIIQNRGEVDGIAAHLQCPHCDHFSKSNAHQLTHMAASHPVHLDDIVVGRLGNILMYQNTARLFHCSDCFYTSREFTKLYKHIISKHCIDDREGEGGVGEAGGDGSDGGEKEKMEGEEEGEKDALKRKTGTEAEEEEGGGEDGVDERGGVGGDEAVGDGSEGGEKEKMGEEEGEEDSLKRNRNIEVEEEEGEGNNDNGASQSSDLVKPDEEGNESVLMFDGAGYSCLICGWKCRLKVTGVNHVMRKHDIPKAYATHAIKRNMVAAVAVAPKHAQSGGTAKEDEVAGLSGKLLKEEMETTAKVVRFISNRFVCLICGWKTKLKGFAISHMVRSHNMERPYSCKDCKRSFFLPSQLQQHVRAAHRPGRFACPFCSFRSHYLGGFRRHCSRCSAREEEEVGTGAVGGGGGGGVQGGLGGVEDQGGQGEEEEEGKEREMTRGERKRRKTGRMIEEDDEEEDDDDDE